MEKYDVYTLEENDTTKEPLFFGTHRNNQRYDKYRFSFLAKIAMTMQNQMWFPEEIKLVQDKVDFATLDEIGEHVFNTQLSKLEFLDSLQGRSPMMTLGQLTTNPEFEATLLEQQFQESRLHSRSYSYMVENMHANPDKIFDDIWINKPLLKSAKTVAREPNKLYRSVIKYIYKTHSGEEITTEELNELKTDIILGIVSMNILEGVRFYLGFVSIWSITEFNNKLAGCSRILQLIQRDEKQHLAMTQFLIGYIKKDPEFADIYKSLNDKIYEMYFEAAEEEFEWADELFRKGNLIGMNADIGKQYVKYLVNQRLLAIGKKTIYPEAKTNPIKWSNKYINLHSVEGSLQESEAIDYVQDPFKEDYVNYNNIKNSIIKEFCNAA